ncbi:MAG TPA: hypothetical protein VF522_16575 [Ramlibacter sp.]|uniref:hypothetical protein n=1 Tax=Ramlibacter sp. TaxID=1917967 RepID=UPI002ECFF551
MNVPRLRMGLVGFHEEDYLLSLLRTRAVVLWERTSPADADALWVCGESSRALPDGLVGITTWPGRGELKLDLSALERPTFFTLPVPDPDVRPPLSFDPRSAASVNSALRRAEAVLQPLIMKLALAGEIARLLPQLRAHTYHLALDGRLIGVVNMGGTIGLDSSVRVPQLKQAMWRPLPKTANSIPQHFLTTSFAEVLWTYVNRAEIDLLPARYRRALLYFRALPRVPQRLMKDTHYVVLSELGAEPQSFDQLRHNVGLSEEALANTLAALYYAGAITTNPVRAAKGATRRVPEAESASELRQSMFPPEESHPFSSFLGREDRPTIPAPLEPPPDTE